MGRWVDGLLEQGLPGIAPRLPAVCEDSLILLITRGKGELPLRVLEHGSSS